MTRYAILLENGNILPVPRTTYGGARVWLLAWRSKPGSPRVLGLVIYHVNAARRRGGQARAAALTPERRSEIARAAARKRWRTPCL